MGVYADGSQSLVGQNNPVKAGDGIVIYCTGLGDVDPRLLAGIPAPFDVLSQAIETVSVTIGGRSARVLFAGPTPGFTGLYQVNAIVPEGLTPGTASLVVNQASGSSAPVGIAVR